MMRELRPGAMLLTAKAVCQELMTPKHGYHATVPPLTNSARLFIPRVMVKMSKQKVWQAIAFSPVQVCSGFTWMISALQSLVAVA